MIVTTGIPCLRFRFRLACRPLRDQSACSFRMRALRPAGQSGNGFKEETDADGDAGFHRRLPRQRRWWPEVLLAVLACSVFLGFLGSVELWGKREQRASAEAIDTVDHNHWLVAQIQGRPRLEKPPLPRWSIAALMILTGRRDEWIVRLPGALAGMATVALILRVGTTHGGPTAGAGLGVHPLLDGVFRRRNAPGEQRRSARALHVPGPVRGISLSWTCQSGIDNSTSPATMPSSTGPRRLRHLVDLVFYAALGLGFLTKGPVILLLSGVTIVPYLALSRRLKWGLRTSVRWLGSVDLRRRWPCAGRPRSCSTIPAPARLVARDVGKDRLFAYPRASLARPARRPVARPGAPVDADRRRCRALAVLSAIQAVDADEADTERHAVPTPTTAIRGPSGLPGGGPSAIFSCVLRGRSPSRTTTCPACPAWPC